MSARDPSRASYLIVGGTTKAATTSMFRYLSDHPGVCASTMKETRFFLDPDYPVPSKYRAGPDLSPYEEYFSRCDAGRLRVEASPDYLHSPGTAARLQAALPHLRLVFILRDPLTRLVSWYRFARQTDRLPPGLSLEGYITEQLESEIVTETPQPFRVLAQGRYASELSRYTERFPRERLHFVLYEDLAAEPEAVMERLCAWAGLTGGRYRGYAFERANPTESLKRPGLHRAYMRARFALRTRTHHFTPARAVLRWMRRTVEPIYLRLNRSRPDEVEVSPALAARIMDYYRDDVERLSRLLGRALPWRVASGHPSVS